MSGPEIFILGAIISGLSIWLTIGFTFALVAIRLAIWAPPAKRSEPKSCPGCCGCRKDDALLFLSEEERRLIWNGYTHTMDELPYLTNRIRIGRAFLRDIGQEPDWSRPLKG